MWAIAARQAATSAGRGVAVASQGERGRGGEGAVVRRSVRISSSGKPAVKRLSKEELSRLLPWSGCGPRLMKEVGDWEACTIRVAASLVACALVYNTSIEVASFAGFYWAWGPILGTALPNLFLRLRYGYAGIWSAQVLQATVLYPQKFVPDDSGDLLGNVFNRLPTIPPTLQLEIGDGSPATFRMKIPLADDMPEVQAGDRVDVMVVSDEPSLSRFKALRDLYLPDRQAWLSEEPCIERDPFERLQRYLSPPVQSYGSKGGGNGRRTQLLLEENTLSRDRAPWEKVLRRGRQSDRARELDYIMEQRNDNRPVKEVHHADFCSERKGPASELDYDDSYLEEKGRPAKELDYDDSYLEKKGRPAKELDYDDLYL